MDSTPPPDRAVPTEQEVIDFLNRPTRTLERSIRNAGHLIGGSVLILTAALLFMADSDGGTGMFIGLPIALLGLYATISGMTY